MVLSSVFMVAALGQSSQQNPALMNKISLSCCGQAPKLIKCRLPVELARPMQGNLGAQVRCDVNAQVVACSSRDDSDGSACAISWSSQRLLDAHGVAEGNVEGVPAVGLERRKV